MRLILTFAVLSSVFFCAPSCYKGECSGKCDIDSFPLPECVETNVPYFPGDSISFFNSVTFDTVTLFCKSRIAQEYPAFYYPSGYYGSESECFCTAEAMLLICELRADTSEISSVRINTGDILPLSFRLRIDSLEVTGWFDWLCNEDPKGDTISLGGKIFQNVISDSQPPTAQPNMYFSKENLGIVGFRDGNGGWWVLLDD